MVDYKPTLGSLLHLRYVGRIVFVWLIKPAWSHVSLLHHICTCARCCVIITAILSVNYPYIFWLYRPIFQRLVIDVCTCSAEGGKSIYISWIRVAYTSLLLSPISKFAFHWASVNLEDIIILHLAGLLVRLAPITRCDLSFPGLLSNVLQLNYLVSIHAPGLTSLVVGLPITSMRVVHWIIIGVPATHALSLVETLLNPLLFYFGLHLLLI